MDSFTSFTLRKLYGKIHKLDKLAEIEPLIDWDAFTPIIQPLYDNQGPQGGRPNVDPVVMVKMLVLQDWYGLSDPELERQANDRISFHRFLGFPDAVPDATTVWLFRERLAESGRDPPPVSPRGLRAAGQPSPPPPEEYAPPRRCEVVLVTTLPRVHVKMVFACLCFNLVQMGSLAARS